jgi:hypothetical protein
MRQLVLAGLLGLALTTPAFTRAAPAETAAVSPKAKWKLAGRYRSYQAACDKADELEERDYDTCIEKQGGYWCVYCRKKR